MRRGVWEEGREVVGVTRVWDRSRLVEGRSSTGWEVVELERRERSLALEVLSSRMREKVKLAMGIGRRGESRRGRLTSVRLEIPGEGV